MTEIINISVNHQNPFAKVLVAPALQMVVIGTGALLDSAAMQWAGFGGLFIAMLGASVFMSQKDSGLTPDQARRRIDEIEKG